MTPILAATATPDWGALPWGRLVLIGMVAIAVYAGACWWFPFGHCRWCNGRGRHSSKSGKHFRNCWFCKGSGRRLRLGRKVYNAVTAARRDAK